MGRDRDLVEGIKVREREDEIEGEIRGGRKHKGIEGGIEEEEKRK